MPSESDQDSLWPPKTERDDLPPGYQWCDCGSKYCPDILDASGKRIAHDLADAWDVFDSRSEHPDAD
jgi:hypothetical protein